MTLKSLKDACMMCNGYNGRCEYFKTTRVSLLLGHNSHAIYGTLHSCNKNANTKIDEIELDFMNYGDHSFVNMIDVSCVIKQEERDIDRGELVAGYEISHSHTSIG